MVVIGGRFTICRDTARNRIARLNSSGGLDTSFDPGTGADSEVNSLAFQVDGRVLIGGAFTTFNGTGRNRIARLESNGALDTTFDPGSGPTGFPATIFSLALQADGTVLIGGGFSSYNGTPRNGIARLQTNGSLDTSFNPGSGANNRILSVALQADGKVLIGGSFTSYNGTAYRRIARLQSNGSTDTAFNPSSGANSAVYSCALQTDGKLLIGGGFTNYNGAFRNRIARLHPNGSLDASFNIGTGSDHLVNSFAVQTDGRILIGGQFRSFNGTVRRNIARLQVDGSVDTTFDPGTGPGGVFITVFSLALQADGKVLIGGSFTDYNATPRNNIARLNSDGGLDATFNPGSGANGMVRIVAVQADGKVLMGGTFTDYNGTARNRIARLNSNGSLDTSFNPGTGASGIVESLALQADGKVLIGGSFSTYNGTARNGIARLESNGSLDTSFNPGSGTNSSPYSIALQADGKVLIAGNFTTYNGTPASHLARLNANGSLDTAFNIGSGTNQAVKCVAVQADGKVCFGGDFTSYNGSARSYLARANNDLATQSVAIPSSLRVQWLRAGAAPEVHEAGFEISPDGLVWTTLGAPARIVGGWELAGLNLSGTGYLRARGRAAGGQFGGSSSIVQQTTPFAFGNLAPEIAVRGNGVNIDNGAALPNTADQTDFGSTPVSGGSPARTFTITNLGAAALNLSGNPRVTLSGSAAFSVTQQPASATVAANGGTASFTVTFDPASPSFHTATVSIESNDADETPFIFEISGTGLALTPGSLDVSFDPGFGANGSVLCAVPQPDGKVLLGGGFTAFNGTVRNHLARLESNGSLDNSFSLGSGANDWVNCFAVQADGKILTGGSFTNYNGTLRIRIARLESNGTLDPTFNPGSGASDLVGSLAVQADGKVLIGGQFTSYNGTPRNRIARLNPNGSLDTTFDPGAGANDDVNSLAIQADGKVLIGGSFTSYNGTARAHLARLHPGGSLDTTFNPGTGSDRGVICLAVQADGKVLIGGDFTSYAGTARSRIARLQSDGSLDTSFNPGSGATGGVNFGPVYSLALQADGKVLIGGDFASYNGVSRGGLARLQSDGNLDIDFNPGSGAVNTVFCLALQADGALLVGGSFPTYNGTARSGLARVANDPATSSLSVLSGVQVQWRRGGGAPEAERVSFEHSINGAAWTPLGAATRISSGWELIGLNLPDYGYVRARGRTSGGSFNGSSSLVEQVVAFSEGPGDEDNDGLLDSWELTYWPSTAGHRPEDDFDRDGLTELQELAFGLNPTLSDTALQPRAVEENGYLTLTINKQLGVIYEVQSAGTLLENQPDSFSAATTTILVESGTTLKVRDNSLMGTAAARFLRVKVTAAP
jgi:uncharacterized delta-60 repeat protein